MKNHDDAHDRELTPIYNTVIELMKELPHTADKCIYLDPLDCPIHTEILIYEDPT